MVNTIAEDREWMQSVSPRKSESSSPRKRDSPYKFEISPRRMELSPRKSLDDNPVKIPEGGGTGTPFSSRESSPQPSPKKEDENSQDEGGEHFIGESVGKKDQNLKRKDDSPSDDGPPPKRRVGLWGVNRMEAYDAW